MGYIDTGMSADTGTPSQRVVAIRGAFVGLSFKPMSPRSDYLNWKLKKPDVGCFFARKIAFRPRDVGQVIETVGATSSPERIAASIDQRITRLINDKAASAATLLFPDLKSLERFAAALVALKAKLNWNVSFKRLTHPQAGKLVAVEINRSIPFKSSTIPSEALVFGPFPAFPATRRSPVPAFEIFVGTPRDADPKTGEATTKANLAHLDVKLTADAFATMWKRSEDGRRKSLGETKGGKKDERARARVAFVMPESVAEHLGVLP